ncbi:hypothetical protein KSP40_PGU006441 [Platanthera guangdongensis]|uniref:Uncharacterized protein n=1 Tax=Platanthera guangdongensis TaxID=2320717 RepID=A0ABR2M7A9_9ASPA
MELNFSTSVNILKPHSNGRHDQTVLHYESNDRIMGSILAVENKDSWERWVTPEQAMKVCNRNFSVGADGVIFVMPGLNDTDYSMSIFNSDDSEPEWNPATTPPFLTPLPPARHPIYSPLAFTGIVPHSKYNSGESTSSSFRVGLLGYNSDEIPLRQTSSQLAMDMLLDALRSSLWFALREREAAATQEGKAAPRHELVTAGRIN